MDVDSVEIMYRTGDEHPDKRTRQRGIPMVRSLNAAPTTQKYEEPKNRSHLQGEIALRGDCDWYCTLTRVRIHAQMPDYPGYMHSRPYQTYWVADVMCQMCDDDIKPSVAHGLRR